MRVMALPTCAKASDSTLASCDVVDVGGSGLLDDCAVEALMELKRPSNLAASFGSPHSVHTSFAISAA